MEAELLKWKHPELRIFAEDYGIEIPPNPTKKIVQDLLEKRQVDDGEDFLPELIQRREERDRLKADAAAARKRKADAEDAAERKKAAAEDAETQAKLDAIKLQADTAAA